MDIRKFGDQKMGSVICPFIGFHDDSETALAYPAPENCCHHAKPVTPVRTAQQRKFCLGEEFNTCPVYLKEKIETLPKEFRAARSGQNRKKNVILGVLSVSMVLISIFLIAQSEGLFNSLGQYVFAPSATEPIFNTQTLTPTPTQKVLPTRTIIVSTPTDLPMHQLETPIGETSHFIIHRVVAGENFVMLSEKYKTSKEAILAANYKMTPALWENSIVVIPVGKTKASGLPSFLTYMVDVEGLTIEALAKQESADLSLLQKYNSLPKDYVFEKEEWVLIPR